MKKYLFTLMMGLLSGSLFAGYTAKWVGTPAISPNGKTVVFGYMGNLYRVNLDGGVAIPLTTGKDYNTRPVWSPDGKTIAFASDRSGNFDVFVMSAGGGIPIQLTYNSANDYPYDFSKDGAKVLFGSGHEAPASSVRFPGPGYFLNLYTVPVNGGRPLLISAAGADFARYNASGTKIVFQDKKGYEDNFRKHHQSAVTRDLWSFDLATSQYTQLTTFKGEDREPIFDGKNDQILFYLNEKDSTQNVYKLNLTDKSEMQLTHFKDYPVRSLSASENGTLAFVWKGILYTLKEGSEPQKLDLEMTDDAGYQAVQNLPINSVSEFEVSPNGKEIAFINRGELFVSGADDSRTKRITTTAGQERMIRWSPDGKYLYFSSERNGSWNIDKVSLQYPDEKYFFASTVLKTESVVENLSDEFLPVPSPDGEKLAYVEERNILKILNLKNGKTLTVLPEGQNHSYSDGDWSFTWSPDSKWLLVDDQKGYMSVQNTALIKADGSGERMYPVNGGFGENNAKWALGGKMMTYLSSRDGLKSLTNGGSAEQNLYAVFFDQKAYDEFKLSKEDYALFKEKEDTAKIAADAKKEAEKKAKNKDQYVIEKVKPFELDLSNLDNRKVKLTINSCDISDYAVSKEADKIYYLGSVKDGYDVWVTQPRTGETKVLAKLKGSPSGIVLSKDESTLFLSNHGNLVKVNTNSGEITPVAIDGKMELNQAAERAYIFDHIWRQVSKKFYDPTIHGIDWNKYHDEYAQFLPYINNNYDFQVLLSEFLGELNASHTGGRFSPKKENADQTASLGLLYDETYAGPGIRVSEIIKGGPLSRSDNQIKAGDIITKINDQTIHADKDWNKYLLNLRNVNILLTVQSGHKTFTQTTRPVSMDVENNLMYKRWTDRMAFMVDSLSNGRLGYVHVQGMNENSFRQIYENVLGKNLEKEALIVDTRFNGGGWLHDDLNTFLSGKIYMKFAPQGNILKGGESMTRWTKPSIVLMSEGNYSDAFIFPFIYKQNKLGKLVGMPVAGTGTAVWWERQIDPTIVFGIPMVATMGVDGVVTENLQLEPDIKVPLPYSEFLKGVDTQLETAVKEMLKDLKK